MVKQYTLTLSEEETNTVLAALGKEPARSVYALLNNMYSQIRQQQAALQLVKNEEKTEAK